MLKLLFLSLFACNDYMMNKKVVEDPIEEAGEPNILIVPAEINYGHLLSGQQVGVETVTIINMGEADLAISSISLDDNEGFTLTSLTQNVIPPNDSAEFEVAYVPQTYEERSVNIAVQSNDADEPTINIPVIGYGDAPVIVATPMHTSFVDVEMGCEEEVEIEISNAGNVDLEISSFVHSATTPVDMEYTTEESLPFVIPPLEGRKIKIKYIPSDLIADGSSVNTYSNDPYTPVLSIFQDGTSVYAESFTEFHIQEEIIKSDIIFIIDNSGSMFSYQTAVASNMSTFMNVFATLGIDYQIGVITTDKAYFLGSVITPNSTDPVGELAYQIGTAAGIYGSGMERGLQMSYDVTQAGEDAGPNSSFLRADALLVLVYISDERDWSSGNWTDYANYFDQLKGNPSMVISHAVIGDYPSGCTWIDPATGYQRMVQFGAGYYDISQYYGGITYSLCSADWGQQMQSMALNSVAAFEYPLENEGVIEDSISVTVAGQSNSVWTYNSDTNAVSFPQTDAPEEGEEIEITYSILGCQEEDTGQ